MSCNHAALKLDPIAWAALRLVGRQEVPAGEGPDEPAYVLEHRDCPCGSTLAIEVQP